MPVNIEEIIGRALEHAFVRVIEQTVTAKAEALFAKAIANSSPFSGKLERKITEGFEQFIQETATSTSMAEAISLIYGREIQDDLDFCKRNNDTIERYSHGIMTLQGSPIKTIEQVARNPATVPGWTNSLEAHPEDFEILQHFLGRLILHYPLVKSGSNAQMKTIVHSPVGVVSATDELLQVIAKSIFAKARALRLKLTKHQKLRLNRSVTDDIRTCGGCIFPDERAPEVSKAAQLEVVRIGVILHEELNLHKEHWHSQKRFDQGRKIFQWEHVNTIASIKKMCMAA